MLDRVVRHPRATDCEQKNQNPRTRSGISCLLREHGHPDRSVGSDKTEQIIADLL